MLKKICTGLSMLCFVVVVFAQDSEDVNETSKQNTKRPSWSAGMPERQKTAELNKPQFKPEPDEDIELDMSEFGLQRKPNVEIDLPLNTDIAGVPSESSEDVQAADQAAADQAAAELAAAEQATLEQAALEQAALEQAALEQEALEQADLEQSDPSYEETVVSQEGQQPVEVSDERSLASVNPPANTEPQDFAEPAEEPTEYSWGILQRAPLEYPRKAAIANLEGWVEIEVTINPAGEVESADPKNYSNRGRVFGKSAEESVSKWLFEPPSNSGITTNLTRTYKVEFNL